MIKLGSNSIGSVYLGTNSIGKAYLGSNLVYQKGVSPEPTPVFYTYLYFDGTAYIDIEDVTLPDDFSVRVRLGSENLKSAQRLFWVSGSSGGFGAILGSSTTSSLRQFSVYYGGQVSSGESLAFSNTNYPFFLTPKRFGWGDTSHTFTKGNSSPTGTIMIGRNPTTGQPYTGRCGQFRFYDDDAQNVTTFNDFDNYTPIYSFRPCTYNGVPGLWCVETSKFYGNSAGSGTLTVSDS